MRGFGDNNAETAMAWVSLATMARNTGDLTEASDAVKKAVASARDQRLRARPAADRAAPEFAGAVYFGLYRWRDYSAWHPFD